MKFRALSPAQDRCLHELRRGRPIALKEGDGVRLIWCVDQTDSIPVKAGGTLLISGPRARMLGLAETPCQLPIAPKAAAAQLAFLMEARAKTELTPQPAAPYAHALIDLAKAGRLIPAFYQLNKTLDQLPSEGFQITAEALAFQGPPADLQRLATVNLPLQIDGKSIQTKALLFTGGPLNQEALALHIGDVHAGPPPLVRLHSACLTGDVFGSLRCDCGPQLHSAIFTMQREGAGCLLYLPQEGRDTGLSSKLRAYALQEAGLDTIDADATLGFEADERDFAFGAAMLRLMGLMRIRLLSNNPAKVAGLTAEGIEVAQRVPLKTKPHHHNAAYLETKARRAGHIL